MKGLRHHASLNRISKAYRTEMKQIIAIVLSVIVPVAGYGATDSGYRVTYDGGSVPNIKAGNGLKLYIEQTQVRIVKDKSDFLVIPASSITEVSYGQDVHRRVGAAIPLTCVSLGIAAL